MKQKMKLVEGSIIAPQGFKAAGVFCDIKRLGTGKGSQKGKKRDLALIVSERPATVAGTSDTISARSRFCPLSEPLPVPRRLMSQNTPLARKPRGATTDLLMILNFKFMVDSHLLRFIYFNLAAQVKHGFATDSDAVSRLFTEKFSATP